MQRLRERGGVVALVVMSLVVGALGIAHRGVPAAEVELNDGGIWVTNSRARLVGHLNYSSRVLDGGLRPASARFDVQQAAAQVLLHDQGSLRMHDIDPALLSLGNPGAVPDDAHVLQGAGTLAVVQPGEGRVWVLDVATAAAFTTETPPRLADVPGVRVVVGTDGVVHALLADGRVKTLTRDGSVTDAGRVTGIADATKTVLTTVGSTLVVLDPVGKALRTLRGATPLDAADTLQLQLPGGTSDRVLLAGPSAYVSVPLGGGAPRWTDVGTTGQPLRPAAVAGCGYYAWVASGQYVRDCPADADDRTQVVDRLKTSTEAVFRVNRDVVVINDTATGTVFLVNDSMRIVDDWTVVQTQVEEKERKTDQTNQASDDTHQERRADQQNRPTAVDDEFGVRPGRTARLPVLANDSDPDGDVLTAAATRQPPRGTVGQVRGGEALAVTMPADAPTGTVAFGYAASDGRGGEAEAQVQLRVVGDDVNTAPRPLRQSSATVAQGAEATVYVLPDWVDPEGDAVFVQSVDTPSGLAVRFRADGVVTVRDLGTAPAGVRDVGLVVSDGTTTAEGTLRLTVKETGNQPPVANADHVTAVQGRAAVVAPLRNDTDPNGDAIRLTSVAAAGVQQEVVPDLDAGTFTVTSQLPGTYYVDYQVSDGPSVSTGAVRVDVAEAAGGAPVADDDLALLPSDTSTLVDVLANDSDPTGGVLVVQSVQVPPTSGLAVAVVDHHVLRVSAPAGLTRPTDFGYTVSNGASTAQGRVTVMPLPPTSTAVPPVAVADEAVVRAGDIVTVAVLGNDVSPSGLPLTVDPAVTQLGGLGDAFVSRDAVRFRAGPQPGTARLTYTVRDAAGNYASAEVVVHVTALDATNQPPQPRPVAGRVLAGGTATLTVPVEGVDPNGDSVTLVGLKESPTRGTATVSGDSIVYTAPDTASGTDTFAYEVQDRYGAKASATVQVGVAPPTAANQSPVAAPDDVTARPGRLVSVNPLVNDVDPDGDRPGLVADSVTPVDSAATVAAATVAGRVELTTPAQEGSLRYYYDISDGKGGQARGVLTVTTTAAAPLKAPVAADDIVAPQEVAGRQRVEVPVLANDHDPDGSRSDLRVSVADAGVTVDGGTVSVPVTDQRQVVLYTVTDADGQTGQAAVVVPAATALPPYLDPARLPATVKAGELLTIPLDDYVVVRPGRRPVVTFGALVKASVGADTTPLVKDERTLQLRPEADYVGPSSITFEVTDGTGADDPDGLTATLTLPVDVTSSGLHQPVLRPSDVTLAAGEAAKQVDLRAMVTDKDPGDVARAVFTLGPTPAGFTASLQDGTLSAAAAVDAPAGTTGQLSVTVTDGTTEPVTAMLTLRTIASTRPLMTFSPVAVDDAKAGQPSTVDLSRHVTNPFADEGRPVTLVGEPTVTGGSGTVTADGLTLTVTPAGGFNGQLTVTVTLADATGSPDRRVQGTIRLTVRDRPEAPTAVRARTDASRTATVDWAAGANNGAPITRFTVRWDGGSKDCGQATSCVVTGLTNDVTYRFTVVATNVVGDSPASAASNDVRPDVKPSPPGTPTAAWGDQQATITWAAAATEGSAVTGYTIEISPPVGGLTQKKVGATTSHTWAGLTNGTSYTFRVQAHSSAPQPSEWSGRSAGVVPAGVPAAPAGVTATADPVSTAQPAATITWPAPNGNGDAALTYQMRRTGTGTTLYEGTALSYKATLQVATDTQTFEVRAKNKAGWGPWSAPSPGVRARRSPGPVTNLVATPTGQDQTATLTFGAADGRGALPSEITYWATVGSAAPVRVVSGQAVTSNGWVDGGAVTVTVWAVSRVGGEEAQGETAVAKANTYGPPVAPTVSCTGHYQAVNCSWSGASDNGRPVTITLSTDNGTVGGDGHTSLGVGAGQTHTLCVNVVQHKQPELPAARTVQGCASATSWAPAAADFRRTSQTCTYFPDCRLLDIELVRWRPHSQVFCFVTPVNYHGPGSGYWEATYTVDANGHLPRRMASSPRYGTVAAAANMIEGLNKEACSQR